MVKYEALKNVYETYKTIGTGGFAKVKLAKHILTGEKVAIKIMDKECLGEDLPRVKMELEALKSLYHHHICRLYQVIETDKHFFLIMEYCAGGELFDHIVQCTRLSEMESRSFFRQILSAVAYLHSKGYVHRDIKPENVLLDKDQNVKLIDFGLCAKPSPGFNSHLGTACGSPTYAAPELIKGDRYLGAGVDVWSMGVMLYALLCGCLPFDSEKIDVLYKQILSGRYKIPEYLSKGSRQVLKSMLETDPARRITVDQLLSHKWVQLGYEEPVSFTSLYKELEKDNMCVDALAGHYGMTGTEMWKQLQMSKFDDLSATYHLLLSLRHQGLPLQLGHYTSRNRLHSMKRALRNPVTKGTYIKLPPERRLPVQEEKENSEKKMQPPDCTSPRVVRKRPRSLSRDPSASPVPKKAAQQNGNSLKPIPMKPNERIQTTPTNQSRSPSARLLSSIERKLQSVRKVLTPKRRRSSLEPTQPTLLTAKNMCNITTTSSSNPDQTREKLVNILQRKGIECHCKGYSIRGKMKIAGDNVYKLSFELEVCLVPSVSSGAVVAIRRKRIKGDSWCYKRVCEEVLKMANC